MAINFIQHGKWFNKLLSIMIYFFISCFIFLFLIIPELHSFLSECHPVKAEVLVIQGWIFDTMMDQATEEFKRGNYNRIILTGTVLDTEKSKKCLIHRGLPASKIEAASYICNTRHHTFQEAAALKTHLNKNYGSDIKALNIATGSVHGKKTYHIFKKVLGDSVKVGIITLKSRNYNEHQLWFSPLGIKVTIEYFIGYLYAMVWNFPSK